MTYKRRGAAVAGASLYGVRSRGVADDLSKRHTASRAQDIARVTPDVRAEIDARIGDDIEARAAAFKAMSYPELQRMAFSAFLERLRPRR